MDAFKLCHHGSRHNTSNDLLSLLSCSRYLYSTNGNIFGHPDPEAVARVLINGGRNPALYFNYSSSINQVWADVALEKQEDFQAIFPPSGTAGLVLQL